ncbi:ATP-dependent DNA helicase DinG [Evansella tamaricis]|uniref:3'-5' exonuclease DinG n=1 Tax=Evansella tamaricis TaxID=2069301 RepID=A0ABS6JLU0_9BACI|nr:ATP-dependent DNA helicase DinG [Evansella tamaricis]MBU9714627.1 ATP-dependent DNA helicase DinG [Evansella tamaricis]
MDRFVIIDVETTGVAFTKGDRIIQIAYVVIQNNIIVDRFSAYINPERDIPPFIQSLTNITPNLVKEAPLFGEIVPKLLKALDGAFFVAHNVEFDLHFVNDQLIHAGYTPFHGPVIDTVELSRIAFPTSDSYRLSQLSENFLMEHNQPHRADSDAEATAHLFLQIKQRLSKLPTETLEHINSLKHMFKSDIFSLLHSWIKESERGEKEYDTYRGLVIRKDIHLHNQDATMETGKEEINYSIFHEKYLQDTKWWSMRVPRFEMRTGQLDMMKFIHDTVEDSSFGLVEAGTGTGKTLAYLIPSAYHAKKSEKPVVISTQTIQLQEQLVSKEIPLLKKLLPFPIVTAVLKGRSQYLCLKKFETLIHNDPSESYERSIAKAQILVWLTETTTGDVEELTLADHTKRFWYEIASDSFSCNSPKCHWFSRCFYQRAKRKARDADLIITNHSLVLSDIMADHQVIPRYDVAVIDEAHHLEDTATEHFGQHLDYLSLVHLVNEMGSKEGEGLLSFFQNNGENKIQEKATEVEEYGKLLRQEWSELFLLLHQHVLTRSESQSERGRITCTIDVSSSLWVKVKDAAERCDYCLNDWLDHIQKLLQLVEVDKKTELKEGYHSFIDRLKDLKAIFSSLLLNHEEGKIYWLEAETKGPKHSVFIQGKPIQVSEALADKFFKKKKSVILTSATLAVNNKFDYIIQRLGLEDFPVQTEIIKSPFQWDKQVQLMIPSDMPLIQEVGDKSYVEALVLQLYRIAEATKGKMLVLFTSYDMLKKSYYLLKEIISEEFVLIAQGVQTGSRSKLTKNFQQFDQAILLGTSSFWEGVDIPGSDLSVIVIVRLPFSPPNDPIYRAKGELLKKNGENPFMKLALPQAIIRFKQGFGRLIRSSSDKGVVIVLDRRIVTTRYGKAFIKSLPQIKVLDEPMDELENKLLEWL